MNSARSPAVWFPTIRTGTGTDVFTERLAKGLSDRGIRNEITWLPLRAEYAPWTVPVPRPPAWANIAHVNSWLPLRFWPKRIPTVVTVHHLVHDPAFRPYRSFAQAAYHQAVIRPRERRAIMGAKMVVTPSDYVRRTVTRFSGLDRVTTIHLWIDADRFSPGPRERHGNGPLRLFMAGSHSIRKGIDLLPAFIKALGPGFDLRYAGESAPCSPAVAGVTELGKISDDQLIEEYRACDAVVSLSRYEGFGYTALEAMACGKPFLGFATSALQEIVANECGILVPVDDVNALAVAAAELKASPSFAEAMGLTGRKRALAQFGADKIDLYVSTYEAVIGHRAGG